MHNSVLNWLRERAMTLPDLEGMNVLEVGSLNENGTARDLFEGVVRSYIGVDMRPGKDVDQVAAAANLPFPMMFDLVISTEMLEHDPRPWLSFPEMARVLKPGGHMMLTARGFDLYGGYGRHDCPMDYWRYNDASFRVLFDLAGLTPIEVVPDPEAPGVFGHAKKGTS